MNNYNTANYLHHVINFKSKTMKHTRNIFALITCLLLATMLSDTFATDGYFSTGSGTRNKGMAGAGISFLSNPFSAANNPAGIGFASKFQLEVGVGLFNPNRQYTVTGEPTPSPFTFGLTSGTVESDSRYFIIPTVAASFKLGEKNSLGVNIWGNGGMNTDYPTKTYYSDTNYEAFFGDNNPQNPFGGITAPTGVNITQIFASVSYARQLGENHSLGISPIFAYQTFEAKGLEAFRNFGMAGANGEYLTGNGSASSTGFGVKIGYQGQLFDGFRLGLAYQPRISMGKFDDYKGLFAEAGGFDIPANWTAGISYDLGEDVTLLFDVKQIMYSQVNSVANPLVPSAAQPMQPNPEYEPNNPNSWFIPNESFVPLGDENGAGFGWDDMMIFKVGAEFRMVENWAFRLGFSTGGQPIGEDDLLFNILAPAVVENHLSLGVSRTMGEHALHFAFTHAFNNAIEGPNPFDPAQTLKIEMNQLEFELAFTF
jgi:long-chain fatty acid transport protein